MNILRLLSTGLGVSLIISIANPGYSQTYNSNSTGTNTTNAPGFPSTGDVGTSGYNQSIINEAQQLANKLNTAKEACNKFEQEAQQQPRRYARQPSQICVNPCQTICQESKAKAESFLESIKNPKPEQLERQTVRSRQLW